jgi:DtxR family Mn-dependent transcriptional regulator
VYVQHETGARVSLRGLAALQGVSVPAVSRMAMRMLRQRMVVRNGACGLALTPAGRAHASRQARRQRIIEVYFVRELGYAWSDVFEPARRFSETADEDMVERMFALAGLPRVCPHGSPIVTDGEAPAAVPATLLFDATVGTRGRVVSVRSHETQVLRYIDACGLRPDSPVEVLERAPFGDIMRVRTANGDQALGNTIARLITLSASGSSDFMD